MKNSIKNKIISTNILIVSISLIIFTIVINIAVNKYLRYEIYSDIQREKLLIVSLMKDDIKNISNLSDEAIKDLLISKSVVNNKSIEGKFEIIVETKKGIKVLNSKNVFDNKIIRKLSAMIKSERYKKLRKIPINDKEFYISISPLSEKENGANFNTWIVQYTPADLINNATTAVKRLSFFLLLILIILASIIGYIRGKTISDPINKLKDKAKYISKRNYSYLVEINTGDEIEDLSNSIEDMALQLSEYDNNQKKFLQNISHELKTPLTSIQGYAEGIKDGVFENPNSSLDIIIEESERLKKLVEEIIFLSKLETFDNFYNNETNDLSIILMSTIDKLKGIALKKNIQIISEINGNYPLVCDKEKLIRAFINILSNSIKFAHSKVYVIANFQNNNELHIYDNGKGFTNEDLNNAFKRFYKGHSGDSGLGLAITKAIIEKTGGDISIKNKEGYGGEYVINF